METNDYVSYELALKLKECGFDWKTDHLYRKDADNGDQNMLIHSGFDNYNEHWSASDWCSAPSLYAAQKWLRKEKEIFVEVTSDALYDWGFFILELDEDANIGVVRGSEIYRSYEQALSAGITTALELIER